jgi:hypothetical protein
LVPAGYFLLTFENVIELIEFPYPRSPPEKPLINWR